MSVQKNPAKRVFDGFIGGVRACAINAKAFFFQTAPSAAMRCGFTLIELLVVVLILGILAAMALPQYQKAVAKSRFAEALLNLRAVAQAAQVCHLEKGDWCSFEDMSITFPDDKSSGLVGWETMTRTQNNFIYIIGLGEDCNGNKNLARVQYQKEDVCICYGENGELVLAQDVGNGDTPSFDYAKLLNLPDVGYDGCCCK